MNFMNETNYSAKKYFFKNNLFLIILEVKISPWEVKT